MAGMLPPVIQEVLVASAEAIADWAKYGDATTRTLAQAAAAAEAEAEKMELAAKTAAENAARVAEQANLQATQVAQRAELQVAQAQAKADAAAAELKAQGAELDALLGEQAASADEVYAAMVRVDAAEAKASAAGIRLNEVQAKASLAVSQANERASLTSRTAQASADTAAAASVAAAARSEEAGQAVEDNAEKQGGALARLGGVANMALTGMTVAAAAAAYEGVKLSGNYEQATQLLVTGAGESSTALDGVKSKMLDVSTSTATSAEETASAMYMIESAGYHADTGVTVLRAALQGAKTDGADAKVTADALSTALTDMGLHGAAAANQAATTMSQMVVAVGQGKMKMEDLASSLHNVLPNASALHVSFAQVTGAIATMTAQGMSAQQATQNLNHVIVALANPTAVMTKAMAAYGVSSLQVSKDLGKQGLTGTLDELTQAVISHMHNGVALQSAFMANKVAAEGLISMYSKLTGGAKQLADEYQHGTISAKDYTKAASELLGSGQTATANQFKTAYDAAHGFSQALRGGKGDLQTFTGAMAQMTGGQVGLQVAMHLSGDNAATFANNVKAISAATKESDGSVKGFHEAMGTFNNTMGQLKTGFENFLIVLGGKIIPVLTAFGQLILHHTGTVKVLAAVVGTIVGALAAYALVMKTIAAVEWLVQAATVAWSLAQAALNVVMDANPIMLIVIAIAALVAGAIYAYNHFTTFRNIVNAAWAGIKAAFSDAVSFCVNAWNWLVNATENTISFFKRLPQMIMNELNALPGQLWNLFTTMLDKLGFIIGYGIGVTVKFWLELPGMIMRGIQALPGLIENLFMTIFNKVNSIISTLFSDAVSIFVNLNTRIGQLVISLVNTVINWISQLPGKAVAILQTLPGKFQSAMSGAGNWLISAGQALVQGLINGVESMVGNAISAVKNFGSNILNGIKSGLGIASPSKVFRDEVGVWIPAGIAAGITKGAPALRDALSASSLVGSSLSGAAGGISNGLGTSAGSGGGGGASQHIHLYVDGKQIHGVMQKRTLQYNRNNGGNGLALTRGR
jgi:TP901 family phage tail tape measure protein